MTNPRCSAVLNLLGEHFCCDWPTDENGRHDGWGHANQEAQAIWTSKGCAVPDHGHITNRRTPVSDQLRDRIAAALGDGLFVKGCYSEYGPDDDTPNWERVDGHIDLHLLADVLIRKLGLRRDPITPQVAALLYGDFRAERHRYVTDWSADE